MEAFLRILGNHCVNFPIRPSTSVNSRTRAHSLCASPLNHPTAIAGGGIRNAADGTATRPRRHGLHLNQPRAPHHRRLRRSAAHPEGVTVEAVSGFTVLPLLAPQPRSTPAALHHRRNISVSAPPASAPTNPCRSHFPPDTHHGRQRRSHPLHAATTGWSLKPNRPLSSTSFSSPASVRSPANPAAPAAIAAPFSLTASPPPPPPSPARTPRRLCRTRPSFVGVYQLNIQAPPASPLADRGFRLVSSVSPRAMSDLPLPFPRIPDVLRRALEAQARGTSQPLASALARWQTGRFRQPKSV
jgi:hypothetical protein